DEDLRGRHRHAAPHAMRLPFDWLAPAEATGATGRGATHAEQQREHQRADRVGVRERVQRDAPLAARGVIAELVRRDRMAELVERDRDHEQEDVDQDPANIFSGEVHAAWLGRWTMYGRSRDCNPSKLAPGRGPSTIGHGAPARPG